MFVPEDWTIDSHHAIVVLRPEQIEKARTDYIEATPFIRLAPQETREAKESVSIKLPSVNLKNDRHQPVIGYIFDEYLQGRYKVELLNQKEMTTAVLFQATEEAGSAYKAQKMHILIEVQNGDERKPDVTREVIYNFPPEYAGRNEIQLDETPRVAKFRLVPVFPED